MKKIILLTLLLTALGTTTAHAFSSEQGLTGVRFEKIAKIKDNGNNIYYETKKLKCHFSKKKSVYIIKCTNYQRTAILEFEFGPSYKLKRIQKTNMREDVTREFIDSIINGLLYEGHKLWLPRKASLWGFAFFKKQKL